MSAAVPTTPSSASASESRSATSFLPGRLLFFRAILDDGDVDVDVDLDVGAVLLMRERRVVSLERRFERFVVGVLVGWLGLEGLERAGVGLWVGLIGGRGAWGC